MRAANKNTKSRASKSSTCGSGPARNRIAADAGLQSSPVISDEVRAELGPGSTPLRIPPRPVVLIVVGIASGSVPLRHGRGGGAEHLIVDQ
jgi:hypothetical protein